MTTAGSAGNESDVFPYHVEVADFPNGLKLVGVRFDSPGLAAYYTVVRVGSRQEVDAVPCSSAEASLSPTATAAST